MDTLGVDLSVTPHLVFMQVNPTGKMIVIVREVYFSRSENQVV